MDSFSAFASSKSEVLSKLVAGNNLIKDNVIYIGDREEDKIAATANHILFEMVTWGYDQTQENFIVKDKILTPKDLYNQILFNKY